MIVNDRRFHCAAFGHVSINNIAEVKRLLPEWKTDEMDWK
jgi:hypothetical protein